MLDPDDIAQVVKVLRTPSNRFNDLVHASGLYPKRHYAFRRADMRGADLTKQDMAGYDLTQADLTGGIVEGADLSATKGLEKANLTGVLADQATKWPRDFHPVGTMVLIPKGTFWMGTTQAELRRERVPTKYRNRERPRHKVTIPAPFYLARYPVTRAEYALYAAQSDKPVDTTWQDPGFPQTDRHPVVRVSHEDATAYAEWLSARTNKPYRLPTEAEWEYACRAGTKTARWWGNDRAGAQGRANVADLSLARESNQAPDPEWYLQFDDGHPYTSPVGTFAPNPFGLYDMLGNVWEWVQDGWVDNYNKAPSNGTARATADGTGLRVLRGGSWAGGPWYLRSGNRGGAIAGFHNSKYGFRLAGAM
jgi:hypothetical protein